MNSPKKRRFSAAFWWLVLLLAVAIGQDFLANGRPLYCVIDGESYYPGLRTLWKSASAGYGVPVLDSMSLDPVRWKTYPYEKAVFAPVPFSPGEWFSRPSCQLAAPGTSHPDLPGRFRHWLGTDQLGRDVAAGMIAGARIALLTGALAMFMAFGIGLLLGGIAGYFGDQGIRVSRPELIAGSTGILLALLYLMAIAGSLQGWQATLAIIPAIILALTGIMTGRFLTKSKAKKIPVPADLMIMRLAEIFHSIPRLILIVAVAAISLRQSAILMIALIGLFSWNSPAMYIRSELLRIRELDYISAARGLGIGELRILWRHAIPNALQPVLVTFALGVGSAILLEASLSFLGFGGSETAGISWGSLLTNISSTPNAWWLAVCPGLAIGLTVWSLNEIVSRNARL